MSSPASKPGLTSAPSPRRSASAPGQAQRLSKTSGGPPATTLLRDARELLLRRLLLRTTAIALRLGLRQRRRAHPEHRLRPVTPPTTRRDRPSGLARRDRRCDTQAPTRTTSGRWPPAPAAPAPRSTTTRAPGSSGPTTSGRRRRPLHRRSGTSSSCSSSSTWTRPACRTSLQAPRSTPAWASSASPASSSRGPRQLTRDLFGRDRRPDPRLLGHIPTPSGATALAPGHRRPPACLLLPHRRRRAAVQRGARLRAAADHAPGHAAITKGKFVKGAKQKETRA